MAYDVATKLGVPWHAAPSVYGWAELVNFARHLPEDSATWRALEPEASAWASRVGIVTALAAVYDAVMGTQHILATRWAAEGYKPKPPKPFPLPWRKGRADERHFGRDPIPVADFEAWYYGEN